MMSCRHTARLYFPVDEAIYLREVLGPEIDRETPKCTVVWSDEGNEGSLEIRAEDISALRAALNSYMRWIYLALDVRKKAAGQASLNPGGDSSNE